MKLIYCIFAIGCAALVSGCSVPSAHNDGLGHDHSHHAHHDEDEEENHHHDSEIHLSEADALQFGIETSVVDFAPFSGSIKVSGQLFAAAGSQVAVTAQSAGVIHFDPAFTPGREVAKGSRLASISARGMAGGDAVESARIAYQAAKRELDRVTPLHADGIVSTSAYNAALQAYDAAKAAYTGGASGSVVKAPIAGVLSQVAVTDGQYVEAGTEIAVVTDGGRLTLRVDLPQDMASVIPSVASARVCGAGQSDALNLSELNGRK
ncbi:MAG: HlyD family efflux transporter periplasmic adaptor subunit [Muribaculaceae bacterium]|nr:HlyD family efflux transporter periplasmic adaptor subunit [Muribaculaceae bacterium]